VVDVMSVLQRRSQRDLLAALIDQLEEKQRALLAEVEEAPEREHAARVQALTESPDRPSTAKGAASTVYRIQEAARVAEGKLRDVTGDLRAARDLAARWDAEAAAEASAEQARLDSEREEREAAVRAERVEVGNSFPAEAPAGTPVATRRGDPRWETARLRRSG
jgi:hypothetical protein